MRNELLNKTLVAAAVIEAHRIVKFTATPGQVDKATSGTDAAFGVSNIVGADAAGERVDVVVMGIAEVRYGGNVSAGDQLTADAEGRAVTASADDAVVGRAMQAGVLNDIGSVLLGAGAVK